MLCLQAMVTQYKESFYTQNSGIITGDNHSVSIANIAVHFVINSCAEQLASAELFVRFIDDILWLSYGETNTVSIQNALHEAFAETKTFFNF